MTDAKFVSAACLTKAETRRVRHNGSPTTLRHKDAPVTDADLVFSIDTYKPMLPNSVTHAWIKLTRKCGLDGVRLHDARHTHASLMLKQGANLKVVSERLGHYSISITGDIYAHVAQGMQKGGGGSL